MFTGIIQLTGTVREIIPREGDIQMIFATSADYLDHTQLGDSIAVNGCCLTVVTLQDGTFAADVSRETLNVTTLQHWHAGHRINLEKALRAGDALGVYRQDDARSVRMRFEVPRQLGRYIAKKGSVAVDGVSLTVNQAGDENNHSWFEVNLVPHTLAVTILSEYQSGTQVNIEIDIIARYIERAQQSPISELP